MKQSSPKKKAASNAETASAGQPVSTPVETTSGLLELFTDGIKDMYWSENHLVKSLPKMISAADAPELKTALSNHLEVTAEQATRLENVFDLLGVKISAKKCDALEGLVMSGEHVIENTIAGTEARDTGIIMSALKVENFEITCYNGLIQLAVKLGETESAELLQQNLSGEIEAEGMLGAMSGKDAPVSKS
jgi:ferritin-like metal-binding protein YciE